MMLLSNLYLSFLFYSISYDINISFSEKLLILLIQVYVTLFLIYLIMS